MRQRASLVSGQQPAAKRRDHGEHQRKEKTPAPVGFLARTQEAERGGGQPNLRLLAEAERPLIYWVIDKAVWIDFGVNT
jgi:hypothetical protein